MQETIKLWTRAGLAAAAAAGLVACGEGDEAGEAGEGGVSLAAAGEGGEGGEAGEAGVVGELGEDARFLHLLLVVEGHLAVAKELYDLGEIDQAAPHFLHPVIEVIEPHAALFAGRGADGLDGEIAALADLVAEHQPAAQIELAYAGAQARIGALADAVDAPIAEEARALAATIALARVELAAGMSDGVVTDVIEYQDAWGFTRSVRARCAALEPALASANEHAAAEASRRLDALIAAHASPLPQTPSDAAAVRAAATQAELALSAFED